MNRRTFLNWMSAGILVGNLPIILAACTPKSQQNTGESPKNKLDTSVGKDGFQALGTVEQLDEKGIILDRKNTVKSVLIFRHPQTKELAAINPTCTHQGCTVEFDANKQEFSCPCHGSKFALNGTATKSPATQPLENFPVKQEENLILVKVTA